MSFRSTVMALAASCAVIAVHANLAAQAHQSLAATVPKEEIGAAPPPLDGSRAFFEEALPRLRPRCNTEQAEMLDRVEWLLRDAHSARWGGAPGIDPRVAENLRARAEEEAVELLASLTDAIEIPLAAPVALDLQQTIDPQHSSLLLRIDDGPGPHRMRALDWDLTAESFDRETVIELPRGGVTHVVANLRGVQDDETRIRFAVRRRDDRDPMAHIALKLQPPDWGRLIVNLLGDEGEPTRALLAIRSPTGGAFHEPPGAVNLRPQLNDIVEPFVTEPDRGYTFYLPGRKRGRYWIVPPSVDATIPVGEWEVTALRGPEQTPVVERVRIEHGKTTRLEMRLRRWTDQRKRGWWSGDDHVHARLMSGADADRLLDYADAVDLHLANILEMGDPLRTYYAQRGFGRDYRVRRGERWLVPGQEDPRSDIGHAIGLNLKRQVRDLTKYLQNDELAKQIHSDGGLYGHTHVGANACFVHREMALFTPRGIVDFNSIMQGSLGVELYYDFLNMGFKMTASAGSDTPYGGTMGSVRVYAKTGSSELNEPDDWFNALRAGRTFVTSGPMLEFTVEGVEPGTTIRPQGDKVRVTASVIGDPEWSAPSKLRIVRCGEELAVVEGETDKQTLEIECDAPVGDGCWIAAHAIGSDWSEAHSTPVYVLGPDGWHGDTASAARLAKKQLGVLDEIAELVGSAERSMDRGVNPMDFSTPNTAAQANAVRARVAEAREAYQTIIQRTRHRVER